MSIGIALHDLATGLKLFRYWGYAALIKVQLEHQKTSISVLWGPLTVFFVAGVLSVVWAQVLDVEKPADYFFYILIGFTIWSLLLSRLVNRAVPSLSRRSGELSHAIKPICIFPLEDIAYSFLHFFITLPFVLAVSFGYFGFSLYLFLVFLVGLVLTSITALALCMTLGIVGYFFRDILQIIKAVMRLGFLITPIIWRPERLGEYEYLVWYNPFYSFIEFCRAPLMGQMPHTNSIIIVFSITAVLAILGLVVMSMSIHTVRLRAFGK